MLRNVYNFDNANDTEFWYVVKDTFGAMEELESKTRNCIRRSISRLDYRIISDSEFIKYGYSVYKLAWQRYNKATLGNIVDEDIFVRNIQNLKNEKLIERWGIFLKGSGDMIGYAENIIHPEGFVDYSSMKVDPMFLTGYYPFYGLIYTMNEYYLKKKKMKYVSDGARTITEHSSVQEFLMKKFKFRKAYCNMRMHYSMFLRPVVAMLYPFRDYLKFGKLQFVMKLEEISRNSQ